MNRIWSVLFIICCLPTSYAEELLFNAPVTVTSASKGVFLHIDSSGRRSLAVSGELVAATWEDNRNGKPAVYVAYKMPGKSGFGKPQKVSQESPAYEPVIVALSGGRFVIGWEEDGHVWLRIVAPAKRGVAVKISQAKAQQISVAASSKKDSETQVEAVWSQAEQRDYYIQHGSFIIDGYQTTMQAVRLVDTSKDKNLQLYPVIETSQLGSVVAWEDRRQGATRIYSAYASNSKPFQAYRLLNEFAPSPNPELGKGSGAMRPVISGNGSQSIIAAWMDKRNWRSGYDVFAAISNNGGRSFEKNEQVQDMFGENVPQWHATVALRAADDVAVVAWDDTRNESPDVFYSIRVDGSWSEDYELPGATGDGRQSHPSIVFDNKGRLHAIWLDKINGQSTLQYMRTKNEQSHDADL